MASFEAINYGLRPGKAIERKLLLQSFSQILRNKDPNDYHYIGFGATHFIDFILMHKYLGISKMTSFEMEKSKEPRFLFNKPFSSINTTFESSTEALPNVNWSEKTIVWLDYDGRLEESIFTDIQIFFSNASSESIFLMSVNIQHDEFPKTQEYSTENERLYRIQSVKDRLGTNNLPMDINSRNLSPVGLRTLYYDVILTKIKNALFNRNAGLPEEERFEFMQLFNITYKDGASMLTLGGMILQSKSRANYGYLNLSDQVHFQPNSDTLNIIVPILTPKEVQWLSSYLPDYIDLDTGRVTELGLKKSFPNASNPTLKEIRKTFPNLPKKDVVNFAKFYRYFPNYQEGLY